MDKPNVKKRYSIKATTYDRRGRIISVAYNDYYKTHPMQLEYAKKADQEYRQVLHAEVLAIIRARGKQIHKIKIERYDSQGNPKDAYPCPICSIAIKEAKIKFIEYTMG